MRMAGLMVAPIDRIVVGVDTHRDVYVAVNLSTPGTDLGTISVPSNTRRLRRSPALGLGTRADPLLRYREDGELRSRPGTVAPGPRRLGVRGLRGSATG
jgi:hypothetical protein